MAAPFSSKVIAICESPTAFVDHSLFVDKMGELSKHDKSGHTYPVQVQALCVGWIFERENEKFALKFIDTLLAQDNLDFFQLKGLQILIDYLYWNMQSFSTKIMFPLFVVFSTALGYYIVLNERFQENLVYDAENKTVQHSEESVNIEPWFRTFNIIWICICLINMFYIGSRIVLEGIVTFFSDPAEVGDLLLILLGFVVAILNHQLTSLELPVQGQDPSVDGQKAGDHDFEQFRTVCMTVRIIFVAMAKLFVFKLFVFMKGMSTNFDILFEVIVAVFYDIVYLVIILVIWCGVSSLSFFLLGQNQLAFDQVSEEERELVSYGTASGSLSFIFHMLLGESDFSGFSAGTGSQSPLLSILFVATAFIIMIHLLNMLIAVMGNTFNERAGIAVELKYKNHLQFVRTKWYLVDSRFAHLRQARYLIAACQEAIGEVEKEPEDDSGQGNENEVDARADDGNIIQNRLSNDMDWWSDDE